MNTFDEIKQGLKRLPADQRHAIFDWLGMIVDSRDVSYGVAEPQPAYAAVNPYMSFDEYLEFEQRSPVRHEYVNGAVYAMTGASLAHARITGELFVAVKSHLRGKPCEVFATDVKLQIRSESEEVVYCPDLIVACNPEEWDSQFVRNPKLVAETASASSRHIDRREKATAYRRVASIEEYVLLEQDEHLVTVYRRVANWRPQLYSGPQAVAELQSIGLAVPLSQIYAGTLPVE